ncbi:MAG: hypothetical protein ACAH82_10915 [Solirubrobacteraceae bacterium]
MAVGRVAIAAAVGLLGGEAGTARSDERGGGDRRQRVGEGRELGHRRLLAALHQAPVSHRTRNRRRRCVQILPRAATY